MIIKIKNLRLKTILGIHDWEQNSEREVVINAELLIEDESATVTNNIRDTIDYAILIDKIRKFVTGNKFKLVEKMAADINEILMSNQKVKQSNLEVSKIGMIEDVEAFTVFLTKKR